MTEKEKIVFVINNFLTLKLEGKKTYIYVAGECFQQCSFLLINIPIANFNSSDEIESIDAAAERLDHSLHPRYDQKPFVYEIPAKQEFWGHCSNLQVWAENGYNSKLLRMNLAFPLLIELMKAGDPQANRVFKEEIVKRYNNGTETIRYYLRSNQYLSYLSVEEFVSLIDSEKERNVLNQLREMFPSLDEPIIKGGLNSLKLSIDIKNGRLSRVDLGGVGMSEVPECVRGLTQLEGLDLSYNPLEELPRWIGELKDLRILKITNSGLKDLPKKIGDLHNLEVLDVSGNKLESLPDSIEGLESLKVLELYQNNLKTVTEGTFNLENLEVLALYENKLMNLSENLGKLKNLRQLTLSENRFSGLPSSIGKLKNLKYLVLDHNEFGILPVSIGNLKSLEVLHASQNPLYKLDESIYNLPNLKDFWILDVPIEEKIVKNMNFLNPLTRVHYQKKKELNMDLKKEKEDEAELIMYRKEMDAHRKKLEMQELLKEKELKKFLLDAEKLIKDEKFQLAEERLSYIIRKAKFYHLNVIEQLAKDTLRKL